MATVSHKFQAPKGTRDFYPQDMAVRRHIENIWRTVSINHGFDEIEGPTFEYLDLYTHKSGPGIANELFQVFSGKDEEHLAAMKAGAGAAPYALRPEFTPTLARMVAARANELPKPIKWFAIPSHFRAERPQRGRLREFMQWNVDFIGDDSPRADAEVIATAINALRECGLKSGDIFVSLSHRRAASDLIKLHLGASDEQIPDILQLLDRRAKLTREVFSNELRAFGIDIAGIDAFDDQTGQPMAFSTFLRSDLSVSKEADVPDWVDLVGVAEALNQLDPTLMDWCIVDFSVVRGLAYYTGTVFEIHEATGAERAIAGGGRYDNLIESFGGPSLPACGFGMGDVVLSLVLKDKGLLKEETYLEPLRPHAFVIAADDNAAARLPSLVAKLRREGLHVRHSYKTTRNVGKLLGDAGKSRARFAIILGKELEAGNAVLKDLESGEQKEVALDDLAAALRA